MSLSTAMYSGLSGLNSYGEAMSVVGDNISNLNTTGYKYSSVHFEDLMAQLVPTGSGPGQGWRSLNVPLPNDPTLVGVTIFLQSFVFDPATETFGEDREANGRLKKTYRKGYELPKV